MRISTIIKAYAILGMALILTLPLAAQTTYTWSGLDTTWSTASAWSPNGVPGATDTAVVNGGIITLDSDVDLGGFVLQGGIISGSNTFNISGTYTWIGGRWQGSGTTNIAAGAQTMIDDINLKIIDGWQIVNNGAATWSNTGDIRIQGGGSLTNGAGGVFTIQNSAFFDISTGGGTVTNNGILTKTSTGTTTIEMTFNNNGTVNLNNGSLQILSGGGNAGAIYNLANGAILGFQSSTHTFNNSAFNGSGTVDFANGMVATVGGVNGLSVAGGITLNMTGNNTAINGTGPVTINGTLNWSRNEIAGSGAFTINGNMIVSGTSSRNINGRTLTNNGTITWSGNGTLRLLNNAQIINNAGASFITSIDGVLDFLDPNGGSFTNNGTFTKSAGAGNTVIDVAFHNTGTVNVNSGNLRITRGSTANAGTYNMAANAKLEFDGGTHVLTNPTLTVGGTLQISSNTVTINGSGINLGTAGIFNMNGGTLNGNAPLTSAGTINWNGGILSGSGALTSNNLMNIAGGATKTLNGRNLTNNGTINWSGTGAVNLDNNAQFINQSSGVMNLNDVVEMDFVFPGGGALVNNGTINRNIGAGETLIDVPVTNSGTLNLNIGNITLLRGSSSNGSTYSIAPGSILELNGGAHTINNTVINGGGALNARDAVLTIGGVSGLVVETGSTLETLSSATQISGSGPVTVDGTFKWNRGDISGSAPFTVNGTLDINGINTRDLNGRTITNNGLMKWSSDGVLRLLNNAQVLNQAGGTIDMQADGSIDFFTPGGGTVVNNGTFQKTGGIVSSFIDVNFTSNGPMQVNTGLLRMTNGGNYNNTISLAGGAMLEFDGGTHTLNNTLFDGNGSVKLTSNYLSVNGTGATFNPGVSLVLDGGALQGSGAVNVNGPMSWNRSIIGGTGAFTVTGPLTVQGTDTRILDGRVFTSTASSSWSGTGETRFSNNAQLINDINSTMDLQSDANFTVALPGSGTMINKGTLLKSVNNLGSTNISMSLNNTGTLNIAAGTLRMLAALNNNASGTIKGNGILNISSGSLVNNGKVAPGASPGTLTIIGNYAPSASAALEIEIGGTTPGSQYDQLLVTGNATLNGVLNVPMVNGFIPAPGATFEVMTFASRTGQFSSINATAPGIDFIPTYNNSSLLLTTQLSNVAPVAVNDTAATDEDVAQGVNVLANDYDLNGDAMSITGFTQPAHGTVSQAGDSVLTYTPAGDFFGTDTFTYIIAEGTSLSDTATVHMNVNPVNDAPVVSGIPNVNFPEDGSTTLTLDPYVSDIDNGAAEMTWTANVIAAQTGTQPDQMETRKPGANGIEVDPTDLQISINPATRVATFTSTADTSGIFTAVFSASDPGGLSDSDTILVTVSSVNDPPFAANPISDRSYVEDSGAHTVVTNLDSVFADPDPGAAFSYSATSSNSNMLVSVQNKSLIVNSVANAFGSAQITVTATDGGGLSGSDQFNLQITPVNDPPVVAGIPNVNFPEDGSTTLDLDPYASDVDNDPAALTWSANVIAAQAGTQLEPADRGKSGQDGPGGIEVDPTDLQISINPTTHIATFTSTADTNGVFTVVFSAADPGGLSDSDTILVTVSSVNDPPFAANPISDRSYAEDSGAHTVVTNLDSVFADPDPGAVFSYSAFSNNSNMQVSVQNKSLIVNSSTNTFGSAQITVTATDGGGLSGSDQFNLQITPVNDPPVVAGIPNVSFPEDGSTTLGLNPYASDIDNDPAALTWSANVIAAQAGTQLEPADRGKSGQDSPSGIEVDPTDLQISINPTTHVATFTSTADTSGIFTVAFSAADPGGLSDSDTILVTVNSANDPPFAAHPISNRSYAEDSGPHTVVTNLDSVFSDPDPGSVLSYSAGSNNNNVQVSVQNKSLVVNSAANFFGNAVITVTATDGGGLSGTDQFNLQITPVNDPPVVAGIPNVSFPEDGSKTLDLSPYGSDIDNAPATLSWSANVIAAQAGNQLAQGKSARGASSGIEVDPSDLQISIHPVSHVATFTSTADTNGVFTVVFFASDPGGLSDSDTILVTVSSINDPPFTAHPISDRSYAEDSGPHTVVTNLDSVFADPDPGTVFSYSAGSGNSNVQVSVQNKSLIANFTPNAVGSALITVTATDGGGLSTDDQFNLQITPVNDPPVVAGIPNVNFPEDSSATLDLDPFVNDIDNDPATLTWSANVIAAQPLNQSGDGPRGKNGKPGFGGIEVDPSDLQVSIDPGSHVATFTSTIDTTGIFTVVFSASDPGGLSDNDTMKVTVAGANDLPYVANPISDRVYAEDSGPHTVVTNLDSVFADPDPITVFSYSAHSNNANAQVSVQNKSLIINFTPNAVGSALITVTANDGVFSVDDQFNLTITPVNDPPVVAGIPNLTFPEDGSTTLGLNPYASDVDNDPAALTWSANVIAAQAGTQPERGKSGTGAANGIEVDPSDLQISINPGTHVATFTSTADTSGIFTVVFTASDPGGLSDSDTILVTVSSTNDQPFVANPISDRSYAEDSGPHTVVTNLDSVFADPDPGTVFSYSAASNNGNVQVSVQNQSLIVNFTPNAVVSALISVTATDGGGLSVDDLFNLNITPVNDPPVVAGIPNLSFPEDSSAVLDLDPYAEDVDNDTTELSWTVNVIAAQTGLAPVEIGGSGGKTAQKGESARPGINGIEVDPSDLQVSITPGTHVATMTSTADTSGIFTVVFSAADPGGLSDSDTILVTVAGINDLPFVANPISDRSYAEDSGPHTVVTNLDSVFADPDPGTIFSFSASSSNGQVQVAVQNKSLIVNSAANAFGNAVITVTANDGSGLSVDDQFNLAITPVNDAPVVAGIPNIVFPQDSSATLDLDPYADDIDNNDAELSWSAAVINAQNVEVDTSDLQISIDPGTHVATFTVTPDSSGKFTVVFTASDPGGLSDSDTMIVTVPAVVLPFVLNPIPNKTYAEDSGPHVAASDLNAVFFNPNPADPLSFSAVSDNPDIQVSISSPSLSVNFSTNYFGIGNVIVTATTSNSFSVSDTFRVTVISVNDLPVISGLPDTVSFNTTSSASLPMWDYVEDVETADPLLSFQFTASNDSLLRNFKTDTGELILASLGGFSGTVALGIFVTDGDNATVSDTIQVVIGPVLGIDLPAGIPGQYALEQNYPNPFNPNTAIRFQLPETQQVRLTVYSILGQKVRTLISERLAAGYHQAVWDGLNERGAQMSSGVYIYRLEAGSFQQVRKMILLK